MQNKKGISLIVLVITIIVMIILAAAIILSLNNTGIISNANKAKDETDLKQAQEMAQIAHLEGVHKGLKGDTLKKYITDYLKNSGFKNLDKFDIQVTDETVTVKAISKISSNIPDEWKESVIGIVDTVPIPKGFVASQATGENKKAAGLVIYEGTGEVTDVNVEDARRSRNQYVWVPVDSSKFDTTFVNVFQKTIIGESNVWEITPNTTLAECTIKNDANQEVQVATQKDLDEVKAMYESVKKYGGFYIARYEAGLDNIRTSKDTLLTGTNVKSQMNKYVYNYIQVANSWSDNTGGAMEVARSIYPATNTDYGVVSTLTYGVQWYVTVQWLLNSGAIASAAESVSYGNYADSLYSASDLNTGAKQKNGENYIEAKEKTAADIILLTTGALKTANRNNIYDIAGNVSEWTMEGANYYGRMSRGGDFNGIIASSLLNGTYIRTIGEKIVELGFRPSLYIK